MRIAPAAGHAASSASRTSSRARPSERDVVVEILARATPGSAAGGGLLGVCRAAAPAAAFGAARGTTASRGTTTSRAATGSATRTAAAAEHLQLVADDLGRVTLVALLVLPFAGAQAPFDIDLRALAQIFAGDLGEAPEERHAMPLGALLLLAALLIPPALAGGDAQVGDRRARGHGAGLGVSAEVANQNHFVDAARH